MHESNMQCTKAICNARKQYQSQKSQTIVKYAILAENMAAQRPDLMPQLPSPF